MNPIKKIRVSLGYTQERFAALLHVSRTTVTMWETDKSEPGYETIRTLSNLYNIPSDFVIKAGIFEQWDDILQYYDCVTNRLFELIPPELEMPSFCEDKFLTAWLDQCLYENDELQVARWFAFAIKAIEIIPDPDNCDGAQTAEVNLQFTTEFSSLIIGFLQSGGSYQPSMRCVSMQDAVKDFFERHQVSPPKWSRKEDFCVFETPSEKQKQGFEKSSPSADSSALGGELRQEIIHLARNLSPEQKDLFLALLRLAAAKNQGLSAADLVSAGEVALKSELQNPTR